MKSIGETIRIYRLKANMTQEDLGKKLFVTKQAVSKWENGKTLSDIETIKNLVELLNIPHDEVLGNSLDQTRKYKKAVKILIPVLVLSILLLLFAAFDGYDMIRRRMQSGVPIITLYENGSLVKSDQYRIKGLSDIKPGSNGYSFDIDYGEVKGTITTSQNETIEFGFFNTNNWHNVQISIQITAIADKRYVIQTVTYKTDNDQIDVLETNAEINEENCASVFRKGAS